MRLRSRLGEGGLKGFFTQHAEKVIFGVVLLLVAFFIYTSATEELIPSTNSPDDLKRQAAMAREHLSQDFWDELKADRVSKVQNFPERAKEARKRIDEAAYALPNPLDRPLIPKKSKRIDPDIFAPIQVEAKGGVYAVAMRAPREAGDPWLNDKDAVVKPKEEPNRPRRRKKKKKRSQAGGYAEEMGYGSDMMGAEGPGGYMPGMEPGAESEMGTPLGTPSALAGAKRKLDKFYIEHYIKGFRGGTGAGALGPSSGARAKSYAVVAVTALVPYEKQWEEYERALAGATGYVPSQDVPKYLFFIAERAEVPEDPNAPLEWKTISHTQYALQWSQQYAGTVKEIADEAYTLPGSLTMPIPPILLKSYDFALHSEIPRQQPRQVQPTQPQPAEQPDLAQSGPADLSEAISSVPKSRPGGAASPYGMAGAASPYGLAAGAGDDMYSGAEMGMEGMEPGYGMDGVTGSEYGQEGPMMGAMGGGYGLGYGAGTAARQQPLVKYKMVRFFDFTAKPGKSYRYRIALVLEDPNRPRDPKAAPNPRILESSVIARLEKVTADDEAYYKKTGKRRRTYYRQTDWSEPSNVVTVEPPEKFVAGPVVKGKSVKLPRGTKIMVTDASGSQVAVAALPQDTEVETTEGAGKLVTVVWDPNRAAEIPGERDVYHGSFLTFKQDVDALHPLTLQIKTIEQFPFNTDAFVADFRGGETLIVDEDKESKEKTVLSTPGEFLVVDGKGNLVACNEIDDTEEYRRLLFIVDLPEGAAPAAPSAGYGSEPGELGGYGDMMGGMMGDLYGGAMGAEEGGP